MNGKSVLYNGQVLTLTKYFGDPCLFINNSSQMSIPKMQFVGGYPNEYCIYIKDLNENKKRLSLLEDIDEVSKQRGMFSLLSNGLDRLSDCTHKGDINGSIRIISSLRPAVTRIVDSANKQYKIKIQTERFY